MNDNVLRKYIKGILKEEIFDLSRYEKEWKEGKSLEDTLKEVEFLIKTNGPIPYFLQIKDALEEKLRLQNWFND